MNTFYTDRIAAVTALVGMGLMVLTLKWNVNPAEGSVIADFLTDTPGGMALLLVLLVTCMPVWICVLLLFSAFGHIPPHSVVFIAMCVVMVLVQGSVYFMLGKLISFIFRAALRKRRSGERISHAASGPTPPHGV